MTKYLFDMYSIKSIMNPTPALAEALERYRRAVGNRSDAGMNYAEAKAEEDRAVDNLRKVIERERQQEAPADGA